MIEEECDAEIRAQLKQKGLWRDELVFQGLLSDYERVSLAIDVAGNKFNPRWNLRLANLARVVLSARSQVRAKAMTGGSIG